MRRVSESYDSIVPCMCRRILAEWRTCKDTKQSNWLTVEKQSSMNLTLNGYLGFAGSKAARVMLIVKGGMLLAEKELIGRCGFIVFLTTLQTACSQITSTGTNLTTEDQILGHAQKRRTRPIQESSIEGDRSLGLRASVFTALPDCGHQKSRTVHLLRRTITKLNKKPLRTTAEWRLSSLENSLPSIRFLNAYA